MRQEIAELKRDLLFHSMTKARGGASAELFVEPTSSSFPSVDARAAAIAAMEELGLIWYAKLEAKAPT